MKTKLYSLRRRSCTKSVLRLPDFEHATTAVLKNLTCPDAHRGYLHLTAELFPEITARADVAFGDVIPRRIEP